MIKRQQTTNETLTQFWNSSALETTLDNVFELATDHKKHNLVFDVMYALRLFTLKYKVDEIKTEPRDGRILIVVCYENKEVEYCQIGVEKEFIYVRNANGEKVPGTSNIYF